MGRKCKCQITGEWGNTDTYYKAPNNKYYKSQEIYEAWVRNNKSRKIVLQRFATDFLDYKPGQIFPTLLVKKLKELEFYGYDVINKTIDKSYDAIQRALSSISFDNDIGKISYIFAIIKNNINDVYKAVSAENKRAADEKVPCYDFFDMPNIESIQTKHKEKNIKKWLEEDDWL